MDVLGNIPARRSRILCGADEAFHAGFSRTSQAGAPDGIGSPPKRKSLHIDQLRCARSRFA